MMKQEVDFEMNERRRAACKTTTIKNQRENHIFRYRSVLVLLCSAYLTIIFHNEVFSCVLVLTMCIHVSYYTWTRDSFTDTADISICCVLFNILDLFGNILDGLLRTKKIFKSIILKLKKLFKKNMWSFIHFIKYKDSNLL